MQILVLKVSDYLPPEASTHIEDLDGLFDKVSFDIMIKSHLGNTSFELDFSGYTTEDLQYLRKKFEDASEGKYFINFINVQTLTLQDSDAQNASHILIDLDEKRDINLKDAVAILKALVEDRLRISQTCKLDFNRIITTVNPVTQQSSVKVLGVGYSVITPQTLLVLIKLKAEFGEKLIITGLDYHSNAHLTYAFNYFTTPHTNTIEDMAEHIKNTYEIDDLVFVNRVNFVVPSDTEDKVELYDAKKIEKQKTIKDIFALADMATSNIRLGLVSAVREDSLDILEVTISNAERASDLKNGRFKYVINPIPLTISYFDLMSCNYAIHGAEMSNEYEQLSVILRDYKFNAPKDRQIYYSPQRAAKYVEQIKEKLPEKKKPLLASKPDINSLVKVAKVGQVYHNPTDHI